MFINKDKLAEGPGVARRKINFEEKKFEKKNSNFFSLCHGHPWVFTKNFSPSGLAVWSAIANIYTNKYLYMREELYYKLAEGPGVARGKKI